MLRKVIRKKVITSNATDSPPFEPHYVPAMCMEPDVAYINSTCTVILKMKSIEPYEGELTGIEAMRETVVRCIGQSHLGEEIQVTMFGHWPVLADLPHIEQQIKHSYDVYKGKVKEAVKVKTATRPPKMDADGKPVERKARGVVDARTGCTAGSQGHILGTIMLDNKCSPINRGKCVTLMTAVLSKDFGFDEKKAKGLASSWYSTLWIRKPEVYQKGK